MDQRFEGALEDISLVIAQPGAIESNCSSTT
jgi:hypothetical protein